MSFEHDPNTLPPMHEPEIEEGEVAKESCVEPATITISEVKISSLEDNLPGSEFKSKEKKSKKLKTKIENQETLTKDNSDDYGKEGLEIMKRPRLELTISNNLIFRNKARDFSDEESSKRKKIKYNSHKKLNFDKENVTKDDVGNNSSAEEVKYPCKYFVGFGKCDDRYCKNAHVPIINESQMQEYIQENDEFFQTLYRRRYELQIDLAIQRFLDERYASKFPNPQQQQPQVHTLLDINYPSTHSITSYQFSQIYRHPNQMQFAPSVVHYPQPQYPKPILLNQYSPQNKNVMNGGINQGSMTLPNEVVSAGPLYIQMPPHMVHSNYLPTPQIIGPHPQNRIPQFGVPNHFMLNPYHRPGLNPIGFANSALLNHHQSSFNDLAVTIPNGNHNSSQIKNPARTKFRLRSPHHNRDQNRRRSNLSYEENRGTSGRSSDRFKHKTSRRTPIEDRTNSSKRRERGGNDSYRTRNGNHQREEFRHSEERVGQNANQNITQNKIIMSSNEEENQTDHAKKIQEFDEKMKSLGIFKSDLKNDEPLPDSENNELMSLFNRYKGEDADYDY